MPTIVVQIYRFGTTASLLALVTDRDGVGKVTLYYKRFDNGSISSLSMEELTEDWYKIQIPRNEVQGKEIQFWVVAEDTFGNMNVSNPMRLYLQ